MRYQKLLILSLVLMLLSHAVTVPVFAARDKVPAIDKSTVEKKQQKPASKLVDPYTIGCVLPLSGQYAAAGNRALETMILAFGLFDPLKKSPFKLVIKDSKGDPAAAQAAVAGLVREGVICILGPLGDEEAVAVAKEADKQKIPVITLARQAGITGIGSYVFRSYVTDNMQIRALVKYAVEEMGLAGFAALYPDDSRGKEAQKLFADEVRKQGGKVIRSKSYNKTQTDFGDEIKAVARIKIIASEGKDHEKSDDLYKPAIDFDALFIPDSPVKLGMIVPQLAFYNVKGVKLLGTSSWNSRELLKTGGEYLEGAVFVDGFSLSSFYPEANNFADIFYAAYGREPDFMDALVYDAAGIIVNIIEENDIGTRKQFRDGLLRLRNYRGATGKTSFAGKRDADKDVFILTVKDGQIIQIK